MPPGPAGIPPGREPAHVHARIAETALRIQTASAGGTQKNPAARPRLGRPRILLVGCGDVGLRIVARLRDRFRVYGTVTQAARAAALRAAGAIPLILDLDAAAAPAPVGASRRKRPAGRSYARIAGLAPHVIVLAPTSPDGQRDRRAPRLLRLLSMGRKPPPGSRLSYVSTTGVYGDRAGAWTDETTPPRPGNDRARRRLDAEQTLRTSRWRGAVLRVPGIYAADRLPLARLRSAIPVPVDAQDVFTNHIHAEDLARACIAALYRAAPARVYNTIDDTQMKLGQYLDAVADRTGLPRPPRAPWEEMRAAAGPQRMSFLSESRRLGNTRMKHELRVRLRFPDIRDGLAALDPRDYASNKPSTDR